MWGLMMITIEKYDIRKLEDYIKHVEQYRRELVTTHEDDKRKANLKNVVEGVDKLIEVSDDDTLDMMRLRYWECPIGCNEWEDIADYFGTSKTSILRRRNALIFQLAENIGYV